MKIFDMHIHARGKTPSPEKLISEMDKAGVYGGCVFSAPPEEQGIPDLGSASFEERLLEIEGWCKGYEDRLFPVMWIHPREENITEKVRRAVKCGVAAFKMICTDYYVYEQQPMALLREIASLGVPVIFHTGILWDGNVSSSYNRPLCFESLLNIEGLRFSMGHCSWPWIDECIAMYGKFLNAKSRGATAEMFFDVTPGTPEIYRRELFTKLYTIGYNVGDNIMFGLDSYADAWNSDWAKKWLKLDGEIMDRLGVCRRYREKMYSDNLMRFLNKGGEAVSITPPETDNSHKWSPEEPAVKGIIEKWYKRLSFPKVYDKEFYAALDTVKISDAIAVEGYDKDCCDGLYNLLSYLFFCEEAERRCKELLIPDEIITETLADIVTWCVHWSNIKGRLYLGELNWLARHLEGRLFRIGRLQFCMAKAERDIPEYAVKEGDPVIEIHIPEGDGLTDEGVSASIEGAKEFLLKYFPDYNYSVFTCHSWLLDDTLKEYLTENSGIIRFGNRFDKVAWDEKPELIRYLFTWDTTLPNLKQKHPTSSLAKKVQEAVLKGKKFYEVLGVIPKTAAQK